MLASESVQKAALAAFVWYLSTLCLCKAENLLTPLLDFQTNKINDFRVQLQHTLEGARIRRKRQAGLPSASDLDFTAERFRIGSSVPGDVPNLSQHNLTTWTSFLHLGRYHVVIGTSYGGLILLDTTENDQFSEVVAYSYGELVAQKIRAFSYEEQWFVVLQSSTTHYILQLYQRIGRGLERRQTILLSGYSDFDVLFVHGVYYLAVATFGMQADQRYTYKGRLTLYHWTLTQFDTIASEELYGATSFTCWVMHGTIYIAVAQTKDYKRNVFLGSPIFVFNARDGESLVVQSRLKVNDPRKVASFFVDGSYYLVFVGYSDAEIYWWSNGQFLAWQSIYGTANASDVAVLSLANGEVVLAIVLKAEVLFLTLDSTGHYVVSFTMSFTGFTIESLQFMFDGKSYYALALFAASFKTLPHPIWKLGLDKYDLPDITAIDPLIQCLNSLQDRIHERKNELDALQSDLDRVWVTNKEQIILADVTVQGSTSSERNAFVDKIRIDSNVSTSVRPYDIDLGLYNIEQTSSLMNHHLNNVLYVSREQPISGIKQFPSLLLLPTLNVQSSDIDIVINGIPASRLAEQTLKKAGHQTINGNLHIKNLAANYVTAGMINNVDPNDMVLLTGTQNITGLLHFSDVHGSEISAEVVNTIPVSSFVTKDGDQMITEFKNIKLLNSYSVHVKDQTNGEYLKEMAPKILTVDTYQQPAGRYDFRAATQVNGDIFVTNPINGNIDLAKIDVDAAKGNEIERWTGHKTFLSPVHVLGNVEIAGQLNGIQLNERLATISSEQSFTGNLFFQSLTFHGSLETGFINNIDLELEAIRNTDSEDYVYDAKSYSSIIVNNIEMVDFATINGIDISVEAESIVKHRNGVITSSKSVFEDIVVLGDLTAHGINGYRVSDLPEILWLKSKDQEIKTPVYISAPLFTPSGNDVHVDKINDIDFPHGFIQINGNEVVTSEKTFQHDVHIAQDVNIVGGKLLGGIDFPSFREENISYNQYASDDSIYGMKTFIDLEINGPISTSVINSIDISEFMLLNEPQQIYGTKILSLVVVDGDVKTKDIDVDYHNTLNVKSFFNDAVLRSNISSKVLKNKIFTNLKGNELVLSSTAKVGGVVISEMLLKTVLLNNAQFVPAAKTFLNSVHFLKPAVIATLNGIDLDSRVNKVVFVDDNYAIEGTKTFANSVVAVDMKVNSINAIDIDALKRNFFSKSEANHIHSFVFFGNDLDIDSLQIHSPALLDGVSLESVAVLKADEFIHYPSWILSDIFVNGDVFVSGSTNGCDLTSVRNHALQTNHEGSQIVMAESTLKSLSILGNVYFEDNLNEISLNMMKDSIFMDSRYQFLTGDFHIYHGVMTNRINVLGLLNGMSLSFVFSDAMLNSVPQVVRGHKVFQKDLEAEVFIGEHLMVHGTLNGINIHDVLEKSVRKSGFQALEGDEVFLKLEAKNVSVYGYLNGIRFPGDVVMTGDSEHIPTSVFIMEDVYIQSDLQVGGKIGEVHLVQAVESAVTLSNTENILSNLTFADDLTVNGELTVNGMVNNIVLEMVVRTSGDTSVDGSKTFIDLVVLGNVYAQSINSYDILQLSHQVVKYNNNETLSHLQVFKQPIYSEKSLSADFINGVSIPYVYGLFSTKSQVVNDTISFLGSVSGTNDMELVHQLRSLPYQAPRFAYFVLHQELNIDKSNRILPGFQYSHEGEVVWHNSVIWTTKTFCSQPYSCCDLEYSHWLKVDQHGSISIQTGPEPGRFFPLPDSLASGSRFVVWTNSTQYWQARCHSGFEETVIGSLDRHNFLKASYIVRNSPSLVDVKSFRDGFTYLVAAFHYDNRNDVYSPTIIYRGDGAKDNWNEHQILPMYGALSADLVTLEYKHMKQVLLVLGTGMGTYPNSYSTVYRWNEMSRMFDILQHIPSQYAASVLWFYKSDDLLLAIASVDTYEGSGSKCFSTTQGGEIDIFLYQGRLSWIQSLKLSGVVSIVSFEIGGETYLAAASRHLQTVTVFQWQGYSKFVPIQTIDLQGVRYLSSFWRTEDFYLSVASSSGSLKILKAVIRSQRLKNFVDSDMNGSELGDEPFDDQISSSGC